MERLQKVIAKSGICSRRTAEKLIIEGKVKVNGQIVNTLGFKVNSIDSIKVNDVKIKTEKKEYYILYKPKNIISSVNDEHDRTTAVDFVYDSNARLFPIDRLDYDASGIVLLTNDGEFSNLIIHTTSLVKTTYIVTVDGLINSEQIKKLERGIVIDGYKTKKTKAKIIDKDFKNNRSKIRIILHDVKNHQVKKMFKNIDLPIKKIHRESFGHLNLNGLIPGQYRKMKTNEITELKMIAKKGFIDM